MGAFLEKPKTEKLTAKGEGSGIRYGVSAMQGWRLEMEDAHVCRTELPFGSDYSFFGVFDGHAGPKVAQYCSEHLLDSILDCHKKSKRAVTIESVKNAVHQGFIDLDEKLKNLSPWSTGKDHSGTTAIVSMITPDNIIWANCGDSRGILCRNDQVEFATKDHKPFDEKEKSRIEKAGGTVMMQRVNGSLAVSRALGDFDYKQSSGLAPIEQLVSPEPEMTIIEREPSTDQFLLLACDGIFDVMTNEAVVKYILHRLKLTDDLVEISSSLIDTCLNKNSRDNMSVILVTFPSAPKVSQDALEADDALQKRAKEAIENYISKLVDEAGDPLDIEENHIMERLDKELEPEFYVYSKRKMISEYLSMQRKEKFGNDDSDDRDLTGLSDSADAPSDFGFGGISSQHTDHYFRLQTSDDVKIVTSQPEGSPSDSDKTTTEDNDATTM